MRMKTVEIIYRYSARTSPTRSRPLDADFAQRRLDEGNRAFADLLEGLTEGDGTARRIVEVDLRDLGLRPGDGQPGQRPYAAVLGCSDARVPIELIFNEGPNDLFVVRVAGNGLGGEVLGSLRYAIDHLRDSLRLVVVLGHSGCGAISAAVNVFLEPAGYLALATDHTLREVLDRQLIVVQTSARKLANTFGPDVTLNPQYREALIETSIVTNAALAAHTVQQQLESLGARDLRAFYGIYLLGSREVWAPADVAGRSIGLAEAPRDLAAFIRLGDAIVRSDRIASLLKLD